MKVCTTRDEFEKIAAHFYDDADAESLEHEDVQSYFEAIINSLPGPTSETIGDAISRIAPLRVVAFERKLTNDEKRAQWCRGMAEHMVETLGEQYCVDLGEPDADGPECSDEEVTQLTAFVSRWLARVGVWQCYQVAVYEYTAEDIREVLGRSK